MGCQKATTQGILDALMSGRGKVATTVGMCALAGAGAATAAVLTRHVTLKSGQCVTVAKTRVCAAHAATRVVSVPGPPSTTETVAVTITEPAPPPAVAFKDGTYRVGIDIQPGTYQAVAPNDCYWQRLRGFSGGISDTIVNSFAGQTIVTIAPTDAGFESERCGGWTKIG